jgi:hypothetical protein
MCRGADRRQEWLATRIESSCGVTHVFAGSPGTSAFTKTLGSGGGGTRCGVAGARGSSGDWRPA